MPESDCRQAARREGEVPDHKRGNPGLGDVPPVKKEERKADVLDKFGSIIDALHDEEEGGNRHE